MNEYRFLGRANIDLEIENKVYANNLTERIK